MGYIKSPGSFQAHWVGEMPQARDHITYFTTQNFSQEVKDASYMIIGCPLPQWAEGIHLQAKMMLRTQRIRKIFNSLDGSVWPQKLESPKSISCWLYFSFTFLVSLFLPEQRIRKKVQTYPRIDRIAPNSQCYTLILESNCHAGRGKVGRSEPIKVRGS